MKTDEAKELVCPFMSNMIALDGIDETIEKLSTANCICEKCIFWVTTVNGKKEIKRYQIPYDTYPMEAGNKHRQLLEDGYVELPRSEGREVYAKYEESFEGYCQRLHNDSSK